MCKIYYNNLNISLRVGIEPTTSRYLYLHLQIVITAEHSTTELTELYRSFFSYLCRSENYIKINALRRRSSAVIKANNYTTSGSVCHFSKYSG